MHLDKFIHTQDECDKHSNVHQGENHENVNACWIIRPVGDGCYYVRSKAGIVNAFDFNVLKSSSYLNLHCRSMLK